MKKFVTHADSDFIHVIDDQSDEEIYAICGKTYKNKNQLVTTANSMSKIKKEKFSFHMRTLCPKCVNKLIKYYFNI